MDNLVTAFGGLANDPANKVDGLPNPVFVHRIPCRIFGASDRSTPVKIIQPTAGELVIDGTAPRSGSLGRLFSRRFHAPELKANKLDGLFNSRPGEPVRRV